MAPTRARQASENTLCMHQPPLVDYSPSFENDYLPSRLHEQHVVCRVNHRSRNRVNSSLQVAGGWRRRSRERRGAPPTWVWQVSTTRRDSTRYRGYSKLRARTAAGSYSRAGPRNIGPPYGRCVSLLSSSPCTVHLHPILGTPATLLGPRMPPSPIQGLLVFKDTHRP